MHEDDQNPETWITSKNAGIGDWTTSAGEPETASTTLYPFRSTTTSWYDSDSVKRTEVFGYTYPETQGLKYPISDTERKALIQTIENYYGSLPNMIRQSKNGNKNAGDFLLPRAELLKQISDKQVTANNNEMMKLVPTLPETQTLLQRFLEPSKPFLKNLASDNKYLEWLVNLKAEKHSLDGAFSVHVFLGAVEENSVSLWPMSPHYVGSFAPLRRPSNTSCAKCQRDQRDHMEVTGQIPLTIALVERYLAGIIPDISPNTVIPYLTKNLHWRVASVSHLPLPSISYHYYPWNRKS